MSEEKDVKNITFRQFIEPRIKDFFRGLIKILKHKLNVEVGYLFGLFIIGYLFGVMIK